MKDKKYSIALAVMAACIALSLVLSLVVMPLVGWDPGKKEPDAPASEQDFLEDLAEREAQNYAQFLRDEANLLSHEDEEKLLEQNAKAAYQYDSILGLYVAEDLGGKDLETAAFDAADQMGLQQSDMLLLLEVKSESWHVAMGDDIAPWANSDLEDIFYDYLTDGVYTEKAGDILKNLMEELSRWNAQNLVYVGEVYEGEREDDDSGFGAILVIAIFVLLIISIASSASKRRRARRAAGFGGPTRTTYIPRNQHIWIHTPRGPQPPRPPRNRPPQPPSPPPRSTSSRSSFGGSSRSGFGGSSRSTSSRGSFGGSSRGGFGGGSRGGGRGSFGKK